MKTAWRGLGRDWLRRPALLVWALGCLAACRSTGSETIGEPLPFHLALMPTEVVGAEPAQAGSQMQLEVRPEQLTRALAQDLAQRGFTRVTVLETSAEDLARVGAYTSAQRDSYWQERAREQGADLLLRTTLTYAAPIETSTNDRFWLNLPLFLLGGPMCWFVDDRSYEVSARLQANFYDATDVHAELSQWALLPLPLYVEFSEATLDFIERADSGTDYALSFICPAGLLARRSDKVVSEVEEEFLDDIGEELVAKVHAERGRFDQNFALWAFRVEARSARALRNPDGSVSLDVPVQGVDARALPYRYEIRGGAALLRAGEFGAVEADGRHWIRGSVPVEAGQRFLSVRVEDERNRARSYTFPIVEGGAR